jgi:outer membrane protein assembly factor BamB
VSSATHSSSATSDDSCPTATSANYELNSLRTRANEGGGPRFFALYSFLANQLSAVGDQQSAAGFRTPNSEFLIPSWLRTPHSALLAGITMHIAYLVLLTSSYVVAATQDELDLNWHQWRGPTATGVSTTADPPIHWNQKTNIQWKAAIPGDGSGTPIVWNDRVYVVSAVQTSREGKAHRAAADAKTLPPTHYYRFLATCLARETGETVWQRVLVEALPHEGRHPSHSYAAASPVTDGEHLYVSFGSRGIFGLTLDGDLLWERDLGDMRTRYGWGEALTPALYRDSLIVSWDHEDDSFIAALDSKTGQPRWKVPRDEPSSWGTPLVVEHRGRVQVIVNGTNRVCSYDASNGDLVWQCGGQTVNAIPSPVTADGVVYCMSGYRGQAAYAISLDSTGDLTGKQKVVWHYQRGTPYVSSPLLYRDRLYFTQGLSAILTSLDRGTGKPILREKRLPAVQSLYASPVAAAGRIYLVDRDGTTVVLRDSAKLEVLAVNKLNDPIDASPALVGREMFLRSRGAVYCVSRGNR